MFGRAQVGRQQRNPIVQVRPHALKPQRLHLVVIEPAADRLYLRTSRKGHRQAGEDKRLRRQICGAQPLTVAILRPPQRGRGQHAPAHRAQPSLRHRRDPRIVEVERIPRLGSAGKQRHQPLPRRFEHRIDPRAILRVAAI